MWENKAWLALASVAALLLVLLPSRRYVCAAPQRDASAAVCAIDLVNDTPLEEPLILKKKCASSKCAWQLPEGDNGLRFNKGEEVLVACTGKGNHFPSLTEHPTSVLGSVQSCSGSQSVVLQINSKRYSIRDLACSRISKGEIRNKNEICGPRNAVLLQLGFTVREKWYPLIEVCHVVSRSDTLYSQHILEGESDKKRRPAQRPTFEVGGDFYQGFSPNVAYQNANKTLQAMIGHNSLRSSTSTAFNRGHLSPDADFLIGPYRFSTYFYINTVPMWRAVNTGNWLLLENMLRKYAKTNSVDLNIATGVFRILELRDKNGDMNEFFLYTSSTKKQIPVPKFIWKVAYDSVKKQGIAFIVLNDPFKRSIDLSDMLCPNICDEAGWSRKDKRWDVISKGYLYCCEIKELKKYVSYVPKYEVKSVLRG